MSRGSRATGYVVLARVEDIPTGEARVLGAGGVRDLVTWVGEALFALQAACPNRQFDWDGAPVEGGLIAGPRCRHRYSARTGLNPLTTACHVNQSTPEYHYRNSPEGWAEIFEVRIVDGAVEVADSPAPFRKVLV